MRKVAILTILFSVIFAVLFAFPRSRVEAHPVDVSFVIINVADDNLGKPLPMNEAYGYIALNWVTAAGLLGYQQNPDEAVDVLNEKESFFNDYFNKKLEIANNGDACTLETSMIEVADFQLFYLNGLEFNARIVCDEELNEIHIKNRILIEEFPTQTNIMSVYDTGGELLYSDTLNAEKSELDIKVERKSAPETEGESSETTDGGSDSGNREGFTLYGDNFFASKMKEAGDKTLAGFASMLNSDNPWSRVGLLFIVMLLGALHSFEGGHNKVILATMMMNGEVDFRGSLIYVFIFTLTHMSDIIILALGLIIFNQYVDLYSAIPYIQKFSFVALVLLSLYITIKEALILIKKKRIEKSVSAIEDTSEEVGELFKTENELAVTEIEEIREESQLVKAGKKRPSTFKEQFMVAFVAGLAPCLTGWTIFILIVSSGYIWLLLPATIAFGIGVFIVLALFAYLVNKFKGKLLNRYSMITDYAPLMSGVLLLLVTLLAIT